MGRPVVHQQVHPLALKLIAFGVEPIGIAERPEKEAGNVSAITSAVSHRKKRHTSDVPNASTKGSAIKTSAAR